MTKSPDDEFFEDFQEHIDNFWDNFPMKETPVVPVAQPGNQTFGNEVFDRVVSKCREVMLVKGKDYTVGNQDRLYNFRKVAELTGLTARQVWSVYACKHVFAILNYVKTEGKSESEPIEGRIVDAINYLLFLALLEDEEKNK